MPTLLIIEDDDSLAKLIQRHFERLKFTIVWKATGEDALAHVQNGGAVDAVVCDLGLPGMGGARVVESLRSEQGTSLVPIIICSGRSSIQDHTLALEAGADAFLVKPVAAKLLEDELTRLLAERAARTT